MAILLLNLPQYLPHADDMLRPWNHTVFLIMGNQTIASRFFDEAFIIYHEYANLANFHNLAFLYVYLIAVIVSGFHGVTVHADDEVSVFHIRGFNGICRDIICLLYTSDAADEL